MESPRLILLFDTTYRKRVKSDTIIHNIKLSIVNGYPHKWDTG